MNACLCDNDTTRVLFYAEGFWIAQCLTCGQVRTVTPKGVKRTQFYEEENFSIYIEKEAMFRKIFQDKLTFVQSFRRTGRLLDIGAGVGLFVDEARLMGFDATGVEPSKEAAKAAKKHFGIELINKEFLPTFFSEPFDIVVINHVLEHLPDPKRVIAGATKILNSRGVLVIGVPNFASFLSTIKRGRWQNLIPDQHRWHFTPKTLDQLVISYGYKKVGVSHENHDRTLVHWSRKPVYWILDKFALMTGHAEAMFVLYEKKP